MKILKRSFEQPSLESRKLNVEKRTVSFIASNGSVDAHGTVLEQDWNLSRYRKNPVVLWEHGSQTVPIARAENVHVENNELKFDAVFPDVGRDAESDRVWTALEDRRLNCVSVGFRTSKATAEKTKDDETIYRLSGNELYEISIVSVPSNPDAIAERSLFSAMANNTQTTERNVNITELLAKRFACEASDADIIKAIDGIEARGAELGTVLGALGLDAKATQGDATRKILELTQRAALVDKLEPELTEARKAIAANEDAQALREVEWMLKRGKQYGFDLDEKSRKAITAYRRSDPKNFAEDYKVALDGFKAFDDSRLFERTAPAPVGTSSPNVTPASMQERAEAWATKQATQGRNITISQAYAEVVRGADQA